jgi:HEXXH motif-containing protein
VVRRQLAEAYAWCAARFPLSVRAPGGDGSVRSVSLLIVGHSRQRARLLSFSSPQAPGQVFIAADWPLSSPYRLASLLAHEDIHQALYVREAESSPVRPRSLGYSPWKGTVRPGRWVWHAFWTFTCQAALLGESLTRDRSLLERDPTLSRFVAEMMARVGVCLESLQIFDIVTTEELDRCRRAGSMLDQVADRLGGIPDFDQVRASARDGVSADFRDWATSQLSGARQVTERADA